MPSVGCNVNNCSYNNSDVCYANKISVTGKKARTSNNTSCSSFLNEANYSNLTNSTLDQGQCNALGCNVKTCFYNVVGTVCSLNNIAITSNVDRANLSSETYCNSFKCK